MQHAVRELANLPLESALHARVKPATELGER